MAEFKWTELLLLLTILLHLPANTRQEDVFVYHRVGEEVTLPCDNSDCDQDEWLVHGYKVETLRLVNKGKIDNNQLSNDIARAQRLRVEINCSLIIKNFTVEDVGRYVCRFAGVQEIKSSHSVSLFNISQTPLPGTDLDPNSNQLLLSCSIVSFDQSGKCTHSLRWIDQDDKIWKEANEEKQHLCNDTLTIRIPQKRSNSEVFRCQLTSGDGQVVTSIDYTVRASAPPADLTFILVAVGGGVLLILVAMVLIIMYRKRAKGSQTPTDGNSTVQADPDDGLTYVSINHSNKNHTTRRAQVPDTVTYATVKAPTASAGH